MSAPSRIPPLAVAKEARRGLVLRERFRRGGTHVGLARARQLSERHELSIQDVKSIYSYFARHEVDKKGKDFHNKTRPSNGYIAWLLWGGDAGQVWIGKVRNQITKEEP